MKLQRIAEITGGRLAGGADADTEIHSVASLDEAGPDELSFLANPLYVQKANASRAAVIIAHRDYEPARPVILCDDPYFAFRQAAVALHGWRKAPFTGISDTAEIDSSAQLGENVTIASFCTVSSGAKIGSGCVLYPGVFIGPDVEIGCDCVLYPNVVVYESCQLGDRVIVHANTVIGEDGFGYATSGGKHHKIPQTGRVRIASDVEIGSGCAIDRAALGETVIGEGTKMSNLVAIGHGCNIGPGNLFVAQSGIAGSATTGRYCAFGGQSGIAGHVTLGDNVRVGAQSGVSGNLASDMTVLGSPAMPINESKRAMIVAKNLPEMKKQLKQMRDKLQMLEQQIKQADLDND